MSRWSHGSSSSSHLLLLLMVMTRGSWAIGVEWLKRYWLLLIKWSLRRMVGMMAHLVILVVMVVHQSWQSILCTARTGVVWIWQEGIHVHPVRTLEDERGRLGVTHQVAVHVMVVLHPVVASFGWQLQGVSAPAWNSIQIANWTSDDHCLCEGEEEMMMRGVNPLSRDFLSHSRRQLWETREWKVILNQDQFDEWELPHQEPTRDGWK